MMRYGSGGIHGGVEEAIKAFARSRTPHIIEKEYLLKELRNKFGTEDKDIDEK